MADPAASMVLAPDKRLQGGCVGSILFHLFDWHRRRRFSPRRLPPPAKKTPVVPFSSDDKMPIAMFLQMAENGNDDFQSVKRSPAAEVIAPRGLRRSARDSGMCSPGLVARLMGLETMPAVSRERPRRAVDSACSNASTGSSRHDLNLEVGGRARPQKLQRTGASGECAVVGGREAMHFSRSVLSRTRKQQKKLASSAKSPGMLSRRNSTRLMEAAVRILEPGLQQRSMARHALTNGENGRRKLERSPGKKFAEASGFHAEPCRSCASPEEAAEAGMRSEEDDKVCPAPRGMDNVGKLKACAPKRTMEAEHLSVVEVHRRDNCAPAAEDVVGRRIRLPNKHEEGKGRGDCSGAKKITVQNQKISIQDKLNTRKDLCKGQQARRETATSGGSNDFASRRKKPAIPTRARSKLPESIKLGLEKVTWESKGTIQGKRPKGVNNVNRPPASQQVSKSVQRTAIPRARAGLACTSNVNSNLSKNSSTKLAVSSSNVGKKDSSLGSFPINATLPHKQQLRCSNSFGKDGSSVVTFSNENGSKHKQLAFSSTTENIGSSQRAGTLSRDELSALLEQKIRELNALHQMAVDGESVSKSATTVLEELIFALTEGGTSCEKKVDEPDDGDGQTHSYLFGSPDLSSGINSHDCKEDTEEAQPSPISMFDASFSTDSSLSERTFNTTGRELSYSLPQESWGKIQFRDIDEDSLDSETSRNDAVAVGRTNLSTSLESISIMYGTEGCFGFSKIEPTFAREVIAETQLLLERQYRDYIGMAEAPLDELLLDFVELLSAELDSGVEYALNATQGKGFILDQSLSRRLLCDYIIENMHLRNGVYWGRCCQCQNKPPFILSSDQLISEIHSDISKCRDLAGKVLDEIIEEETKHPAEKWNEFEVEAFEAGTEIEQDLFQGLVDEMASDLLPR